MTIFLDTTTVTRENAATDTTAPTTPNSVANTASDKRASRVAPLLNYPSTNRWLWPFPRDTSVDKQGRQKIAIVRVDPTDEDKHGRCWLNTTLVLSGIEQTYSPEHLTVIVSKIALTKPYPIVYVVLQATGHVLMGVSAPPVLRYRATEQDKRHNELN